MKNFLKGGAFLALFFVAACSNEFDLTAEWQDIPVLYAIFDANSDVHYMRVEKAFIDNEKSAVDIAQIPDSLYYDDSKIEVYLENENDGSRLVMSRVDGDAEGFARDQGIFANQPNWIYKAIGEMKKNTPYKVVLERDGIAENAESFFNTPGVFQIDGPQPFGNQGKLKFTPTIDDANSTGGPTISYSSDTTVRYFNISLLFFYQIKNFNTGAIEEVDTLLWNAASNERISNMTGNNRLSGLTKLSGIDFFEFLGQNAKRIYDNDGNEIQKFRTLKGAHFILEGGGKELEEFYEVFDANTGLTGAESVPAYTNVQNGLGLITSKASIVTEGTYTFNPNMKDDLEQHPATRDLNFIF